MSEIKAVFPYLRVKGAAAAIEFYTRIFGAQEKVRFTEPNGLVGHAELSLGSVTLMLSDEFPDFGIVGPQSPGNTGAAIKLYVVNADALAARALAAGAKIVREPADQFYGLRECTIRDPFGHEWILAHEIEKVSDEEIQRRLSGMAENAARWQNLLASADLAGWTSGYLPAWRRIEDGIEGDDGCESTPPENAGGRIETDEPSWRNYEFSAHIQVHKGVMAQLHYRICEAGRCWYTFDLVMTDQAASISKVDMRPGGPGRQVLHSVPFAIEYAKEYDVRVVAQGGSLTSFVDGLKVIEVVDTKQQWLGGQVGVAIWQCHAVFRRPRILRLE